MDLRDYWYCSGFIALVLVACGDAQSPDATVMVRDSVGVTIVESSEVFETRSLGWRISERPNLTIGSAGGDDQYQLFRVGGAVQLPDSRLAVVNAGTQEIRFFDAEGRYLKTSGARGAGPGEFQMPQLVRPISDAGELLIWDMMNNRFTTLDPDGELVRTIRPEAVVRTPQGWDGVGTALSMRSGAAAGIDTPDGVMANDFTYEAVPLDGGEMVLIAELPARIYHASIGGQPWFRRIPLDPQPAAATGHGLFYLTTGATAEIHAYASNGELTRVVRVARDPEPIRRGAFNALVDSEVAAITDTDLRREWTAHYARMPAPESVPVYQGLLVDDLGYLWAEHFRVDTAESPTWSVFDPEGAALGTIQTPEGLVIFQIGEDFLIGRMTDELGVEQVAQYSLDRTADPN